MYFGVLVVVLCLVVFVGFGVDIVIMCYFEVLCLLVVCDVGMWW